MNSEDLNKLSENIKFIKGKKPKNIESKKIYGYEKYLTIACLNNQESNYANCEKMIMCNNDILMVMDGASSGESYFYNHYAVVGSTLSKVKIVNDKLNNKYVYFVMKKYESLIKSKNTGSAIPHKVFVGSLEIPIIDEKKQLVYSGILDKILKLKDENQNLEQLRDTLLPKLMNGEIDLENVEI